MARVIHSTDPTSQLSARTRYNPCVSTNGSLIDTEAFTQVTYRTSGVLSNLWVAVYLNNLDGTTTIRTRVNGSNGNQVVSIGSSTTGTFEDASNIDSVVAGDEVNVSSVTTGTTGTVTVGTIDTIFSSNTSTLIRLAEYDSGGTSLTFNSNTEFCTAVGSPQTASSEVETKLDVSIAGTLKNMFVYIGANTRVNTSTYKSRVNGADGTLAVSITASSTGIFEDTSNSDSIAANDDINYSLTQGAGGGTLEVYLVSTEFETTDNTFFTSSSNAGGSTVNAALTRYINLAGNASARNGEDQANSKLNMSAVASNLVIYISANTVTASSTFALRKNGSTTSLSISIGASTTGAFEDASNTVPLVSTDLVNHILTTGSTGTSLTIRTTGVVFSNTDGQMVFYEQPPVHDFIRGGIFPY